MKKSVVLFLLFAACRLWSWEVYIYPSLALNIHDQAAHTLGSREIMVPTVSEVVHGQPFTLYFAVGKPSDEKPQALKLTADLFLRTSTGALMEVFRDTEIFDIPSDENGVFISPVKLEIKFENGEGLGEYTYILRVRNAGDPMAEDVETSVSVGLVDSVTDNSAVSREEFSGLMMNYYRDPAPGRLFAALDYYMTEGIKEQMEAEAENFNPICILNAFAKAFSVNPQFHEELAKRTKQIPGDQHLYYAMIFVGVGEAFVDEYQYFMSNQVLSYIYRIQEDDPLEFSSVTEAYQLDVLWAEFFITGRFDVLKRIAGVLGKSGQEISLEEAERRMNGDHIFSDEEKTMLMNFLIRKAAEWSIGSNIGNGHVLVQYYLEYIVEKKVFSDDKITEAVAEILASVENENSVNHLETE